MEGLSRCIGGPYDKQIVPGVDRWIAWVPRPEPSNDPPQNLSRDEVMNQSHYESAGVEDGRRVYFWREVR